MREYREGDDIRNMDWKVTARTNTPHLKVYREERERSVVLCVARYKVSAHARGQGSLLIARRRSAVNRKKAAWRHMPAA